MFPVARLIQRQAADTDLPAEAPHVTRVQPLRNNLQDTTAQAQPVAHVTCRRRHFLQHSVSAKAPVPGSGL